MKLREEQRLYKEAQKTAKKFIGHKGVTDIELGLKHKNGELTDEITLRFKVHEKKPEKDLKKSDILPKKAGQFVTDVLPDQKSLNYTKSINPKSFVRPLIGGLQIQSSLYKLNKSYWGTMGCFLPIEQNVMGLTNYHVLYGSTDESTVINNYIGKLEVFQNICGKNNKIGIVANLFSANLDYATFALQEPIDRAQSINRIPGLLGTYVYPRLNMPLLKSGAKTGITYGRIDGRSCVDCSEISIHIDLNYHSNTDMVSDFGDSGSVWILNEDTDTPRPVALHYAGGQTHQIAKAKTFVSIFASIRNKINNQKAL